MKSNNTRLTNALQESTANVEEWKRQLQSLKDENTKMKHKVPTSGLHLPAVIATLFLFQIVELEASHGNPEAIAELRKEIHHLRSNCESFEAELKQKDCEIDLLKKRLEEQCQIYGSSNQKVDDKIKVNDHFRSQQLSSNQWIPHAGFVE